jgi:hypothetical protein
MMKPLSKSSLKDSIFSKLFFVFLLMFASAQLHAALQINSVTVNGGNPIPTGSTSTTIAISTTITGGSSGATRRWWSTAYSINGDCYGVNTDDYSVSSTGSVNTPPIVSFNTAQSRDFIERLPVGVTDVQFWASGTLSGDACAAPVAERSPNYTVRVEKVCSGSGCLVLDCDTLYGASDISHVYKFNNPAVSTAQTALYRLNDSYAETIAVGPFAKESGKMTMFNWDWNWDNGDIRYIHNGSSVNSDVTSVTTSIDGTFRIARPNNSAEGYGAHYDYWSGGEVNQITGQIYFSSSELSWLNYDFMLMLVTPVTSGTVSNFTKSGKIQPKTPNDALNTNGDRMYVASDMAIDAEGNAYLLANSESGAVEPRGNWWLVKVEPGTTGNWKYSKVKQITNMGRQNIYGMAFLNGKLYAAAGYPVGERQLYEINPLTGVARSVGDLPVSGSASSLKNTFDLASCQVATAITGKVYYDEDGDGVITGNEKGIPNVVVALYDKNGRYLGEQTTSASGEYSLLSNDVGRADSVLYVRLKQPYIDGSNAHQTWASGGETSWTGTHGKRGTNIAEPICYNPLDGKQLYVDSNQSNTPYPNQHRYYYGRKCYGANANGIDPSYTNFDTTGGRLNGANYYTKVTMPTDRANVRADFALGPIDRGDAPASYGDASQSMIESNLLIGDKIDADNVSRASADALGDDKNGATPDDEEGVWITIPTADGLSTQELKLDATIFTSSTDIQLFTRVPYKFRVKVKGDGYLNAWTHIKSTGNTGSFTERMHHNYTDIQDGGAGDEDGIKDGDIEFTYVIPRATSLQNIQDIFFRFRYSAIGGNQTQGLNPSRGNVWWDTHAWTSNGEVEDYRAKYDGTAVPFYCNILYATAMNATLNAFKNPAINTEFIDPEFYFMFNVTKYGNMGSLAIGEYLNKITMFTWSYNDNKTMKYVHSKQSNVGELTNPLLNSANTGAMRFWSGGVMSPQNQTIYLSGYVNTTLHASPYARVLTYNVGGTQSVSGSLSASGAQINGQLASDAFLGADGQIYTLAEDGAVYHLIRINPHDWKYSRAATISGALSRNKIVYGLAFHNGKIYASTTDSKLYEIDPTSGASKEISGSIWNHSYYDLATCQVAPVITGTLYFDKNADGVLSTAEKSGERLANVTVEIYDKNRVFLSDVTTNDRGEYGFLLNSLDKNTSFYIRVKQPHIGGERAVQTWAGGASSPSIVYRVCDNANISSEGECYGVNGPLGEDGGDKNLSNANYYSILVIDNMASPMAVDFGFSGVDRSDTPSSYGEVYHSAIKKVLTIGNEIDADLVSLAGGNADKDLYDEGVEIKPDGGTYAPLQGATLEANTNYTIRVSLNGNMSSQAQLRAWISLHNTSGKTNAWMYPIHTSSNNSGSFVEFSYTVPMSMFGDEDIYFRFRLALENTTLKGNVHNGTSWAWNIGEVEDYKVRVKNNNPRDLEEIFNEDLYGDVAIIGNTIMARADNGTAVCPADNAVNDDNTANNTAYWNVDNYTSSSSSSYLDIPPTATIKAAFLRWQGANIRNMYDFNKTQSVTLTDASGALHTVTAETTNWYNHAYQGTANITNIINGAGNYTVGNIFTRFDKDSYGAWAIIVVYDNQADNDEVLRKAVVYDGFAPVENGNAKGFSFGNFKTSSAGGVDSKMYLFAGEGDLGGSDTISLNNKTIGGYDPIKGYITYFDSNVLSRNESCKNNLAADVHTYNVGTNSSNQAIGNAVESVDVRFNTGVDTYYVGLVGLSIQLYEPRVCYYIDNITNAHGAVLFQNGTFGTNTLPENEEYQFKMFIANIQDATNSTDKDEARNVQAHLTYLKPSELQYVNETTSIDNVGGGFVSQTDAFADDLGEYNNVSYKHTWRLGHGADDTKGGSFAVSYDLYTSEKSNIDLKMYLGNLPANASKDEINLMDYLRFQASYNSGVNNTTRIKDIAQCRDMNLIAANDPVIGSFNVVNEKFNSGNISTDKDHEDNALYTQVAGKPFNVKLVALKEYSGNTPLSTLELVDYDTNKTYFKIDLVDGDVYDTCENGKNKAEREECCQNAPSIVVSSNIDGFFNQDNNTIGTMRLDDIETNVTTAYGKFRVTWNKIVGDNTTHYSCSLDRFAIRPAGFDVNIPAGNLIGGAENNVSIQALTYTSNIAGTYNKTASSLSHNATLKYPSSCNASEIDVDINSTNFFLSHTNFYVGSANLTVRYNNVGNISSAVIDNNFTFVDQVEYDDVTTKYDCHQNSSSNDHNVSDKKLGCDIASNDTTMKFVPKYFGADITVRNAKNGVFTYLSNDENMAAEVITQLRAVLGDSANTTAHNYHRGCFADDVEYNFMIQNNNFTDYGVRSGGTPEERAVFFERNHVKLVDNNMGGNGIGGFEVGEGNFTNGVVGSVEFGFNFERKIEESENPFILYVPSDINMTNNPITDTDTHLTEAIVAGDNITFFYGRTFIGNYEGPSPAMVNVNYEIFCQSCNMTRYGIDLTDMGENSHLWFINRQHDNIIFGDTGNYIPIKGALAITPNKISVNNGIAVTEILNANPTPYEDTIHATPSSWLIYNQYNAAATDISFTVKFIGDPGGWAGKGDVDKGGGDTTGTVLERMPDNKTKMKAVW